MYILHFYFVGQNYVTWTNIMKWDIPRHLVIIGLFFSLLTKKVLNTFKLTKIILLPMLNLKSLPDKNNIPLMYVNCNVCKSSIFVVHHNSNLYIFLYWLLVAKGTCKLQDNWTVCHSTSTSLWTSPRCCHLPWLCVRMIVPNFEKKGVFSTQCSRT